MEITTRERNAYAKKHIENEYHLRRWTPIRYIDNTKETGLKNDTHCCVIGKLISVKEHNMRSSDGTYVRATVIDRISKQYVSICFFHQPYALKKYKKFEGMEVFVSGKACYDEQYGWSIKALVTLKPFSPSCFRVIPIYSKIRGITEEKLSTHLDQVLAEQEEETVPDWMRGRYRMCGINEALRYVMKPETPKQISIGMQRLLFDDLFYMAAQFTLSERHARTTGSAPIQKTDLMQEVISRFPYKLTNGQQATVEQIVNHMEAGRPLHALVQGDVGSGKTITGFLPMVAAAENGIQACLVAPTKILARQHYEKLCELLDGMDIRVGLFAGTSIKKKELKELAAGDIQIAIGTHSLMSDRVLFKNLGLLVIDEEHKFGVEQRQKLMEKSSQVDVISMSATPIPRTLARAVYGSNIEVFSIKDRPGGRKPVITQYDTGERRKACIDWILKKKQQVYVVCPAIDTDDSDFDSEEKNDMMSVTKAYSLYQNLFPDANIATLDGKMKQEETDVVLDRFRGGEIDILIATTVVEVGVDVPNATLIIIESAERFGLAQMHQLRGRVGRGKEQSYCLLISDNQENERIQTLCQVSDGFEISRIDMETLRKSGNLFGEEQSGYNQKVEEMIAYESAYQAVLNDARTLSDEILQKHIEKVLKTEFQKRRSQIQPTFS